MVTESLSFSPYLPLFVNLIRYVVFAGLAFLLVYKLFSKQFYRNKIQHREAKRSDFLREIKNSIFSTLVFGLIGFVFIHSPLKHYTQIYTNVSDYPLWWLPVSVLVLMLIQDTYFYWIHRLMHTSYLYKRVHLIHHQSVNPSPWAAYSFHLSEAILEALIVPLMLLMVPTHPLALFTFTFAAFFFSVYGHLGYEIMPKWFRQSWLFEILSTSVYHNMHHAKVKTNYGLYFRFWDRVMQTEDVNYVKDFDAIQARRFEKVISHELI